MTPSKQIIDPRLMDCTFILSSQTNAMTVSTYVYAF